MSSRVGADVLVIGGGIAGVSAAHHLAADHSVILVEAEPALAHHTTGRSAAQFLENYGGPVNRRLTLAGREFMRSPPPDLVDGPLLSPCAMLTIGRESDVEALTEVARDGQELVPTIELIDGEEARGLCPALRPEAVAAAVLEPDAADIDVMALHQGFVRGARAGGAEIRRGEPLVALAATGTGWRATTPGGTVHADVVVNAAGSWGDRVATMGAVAPVGLMPLRRTAFTVTPGVSTQGWPLVHPIDEGYYFKPEAGGQLFCSLADENPTEPCDARVEEIDVALALDRINTATTLDLRSVGTAWAGLRSFVVDRQPVIGFDDGAEGFVWLVGQGGTGIQTAPAAGRVVASLISNGSLPADLEVSGVTVADLGPARLENRVQAEGRHPEDRSWNVHSGRDRA